MKMSAFSFNFHHTIYIRVTYEHDVSICSPAIFKHYHSLGVKMQSSEEVSVSPMVVMKLQHASLSAIRNLCVPMVNKRRAAAGPAPAVFLAALPHVQEHNVAYKLLAAIRMLLDGQGEE